jgi:hypothetical protein
VESKPDGILGTDSDSGVSGASSRWGRLDGDEPWWEGRGVAIRPDVPGPGFDPEALVLIRSDEERSAAQAKISRSIDDMKSKSDRELWPQWLWNSDDDLSPREESETGEP